MSLTITATSAYYVYASAETADRNRFTHLVQDARDEANRSLERYLSALRGTVGLYAAFGRVDRRSFDAYAAALDLPEQYRGMRGLGFVARVPVANRDAFLAEARRESGSQFKIWSADEPTTAPADEAVVSAWSGDAFVVRYVAPAVAVRRPVLGYDMASDPARRAAMVRACDAASAVVTQGLLFLRGPDGERHAGFLIFIPVYGPDGVPGPVDARRRAVTGFVYASFRSDDLMQHIVASNINARLRMRVYDGPAGGTAGVLFDSDPPGPDEATFRPLLHDRFTLAVAGATWTVSVTERPAFYMESDAGLIPFVLVGGAGISLVLFAVARSQAVARDDAERTATVFQQAQRALAASQSRLRRLVDANLIGVFFCDLAGEVSGGNDEFFRLIGQGRGGDGRSLALGDITVPQDREQVVEALRQVGRDGVSPAFETAFVRAGGPPVPVLLGVASVYPDDVDHIPGAEAVAFALDLSDRYRAEQALRSAKEAAEKANRSKDQFLAMLSHELRTPLTPVLAATAGYAIDPSLPAAVRSDLAMIHRNVELEARLIDDLLDLTRVSRGKLQLRNETVDLHRVIADAVAVVPPELIGNKRLSVEQDLSAPAHHVRGDAARLQQVFWNLVKNAVKFTPPGGHISIRTFNPPATAHVLRVEVSDTGLGIEADILPKLFDAFEQGSMARAQASGGLGLGLAISRGLVEAHSGRITAESSGAGQGATFIVELATVPPPPPPLPAPSAGSPSVATAFRILLVEDHVDTARVMARLLTRAGHAVSVASCVADALGEMDRGPFDLLVSDLGLPDGSGTDVVRGFRKCQGEGNSRAVGAIALTGFGTEGDVTRTRAAGFDEHLTKPVAFDLLEKAIARVMAQRTADIAG